MRPPMSAGLLSTRPQMTLPSCDRSDWETFRACVAVKMTDRLGVRRAK